MPSPLPPVTFRFTPRPADSAAVRDIVVSTSFFNPAEIAIAVELIDDALARGAASDYRFLFADLDGRPVGYVCHGPIAGTQESFDLYWIVVHNDHRGQGLGRRLMAEAEKQIHAQGGRRIYVETSSRDQYAPTRGFYKTCDYQLEATIKDFYAPGDSKLIYVKIIL